MMGLAMKKTTYVILIFFNFIYPADKNDNSSRKRIISDDQILQQNPIMPMVEPPLQRYPQMLEIIELISPRTARLIRPITPQHEPAGWHNNENEHDYEAQESSDEELEDEEEPVIIRRLRRRLS